MRVSGSARCAAAAFALAVAGFALPFWLARDRPWMSSDTVAQAAFMGGGPPLVLGLIALVAVAAEAARGEALPYPPVGCLVGMLIGCVPLMGWVLLISSAQNWF